MTKTEAIIHYKAAISVFRIWLKKGFITPDEFTTIDTMITNKYGISSCSIFRELA